MEPGESGGRAAWAVAVVCLLFGCLLAVLRCLVWTEDEDYTGRQTDREGDGRSGLNSECPPKALPKGITMSVI